MDKTLCVRFTYTPTGPAPDAYSADELVMLTTCVWDALYSVPTEGPPPYGLELSAIADYWRAVGEAA